MCCRYKGVLTWQDETLRFGKITEVDWTIARMVVYISSEARVQRVRQLQRKGCSSRAHGSRG